MKTKFVENPDTGLYSESHHFLEEQRLQKYSLYLNNSDIPSFYHNISFDNYEGNKENKEFKQVKYYAENILKEQFNHVSLYLWGSNGTQKTALACNVGKTAMMQGLRVKFILAGDLISKFLKLQGFHKDIQLYEEVENLKTYDMLIIDDCWDSEKAIVWKNSNDLIIAEWDTFLRGVLGNGVKIVMTSNYSLEIVEQKYGKSLFELLDRNFYQLQLTDCVKHVRKLNVASAFQKCFEEIE